MRHFVPMITSRGKASYCRVRIIEDRGALAVVAYPDTSWGISAKAAIYPSGHAARIAAKEYLAKSSRAGRVRTACGGRAEAVDEASKTKRMLEHPRTDVLLAATPAPDRQGELWP